MGLHGLLLLSMAVLGLSAMNPMPMCASESPTTTGHPSCTLTYTPYMAPQIGPTTTLWGAIMTTYFYVSIMPTSSGIVFTDMIQVVDCHYCTVTNFEHNPTPQVRSATPTRKLRSDHKQGPFTAKTTSSMLTITRVECMPETTAITRREYRGFENNAEVQPRTVASNELNGYAVKQAVRRSDTAALVDLAATFSNDLSPDIGLLSGPAKDSLTEIWSAMFALNVADSGMNVTLACQQVQTTEVRYQLLESDFDPDKVKALLCWIAVNGYDFNTTREQIFSTLESAAWGLEVASGFSTNRTTICDDLDLFGSIGGYLGINTQQYQDVVCTGIPSKTPTPTPSGYYGVNPTTTFVSSGMTTGWASTSWGPNDTTLGFPTSWTPNATIWGSGTAWAPNNSSTWGPPISYTGTITSWSTNATLPTDTGVASDTALGPWNQTFIRARTPPSPTAKPFYPAVPTTTRHSLFKRY